MPKPYRSDGKQTMSPIEVKRAELARKKREIIRGQNTQTAAAAKKSAGTLVGSGPIVI